MAAKKWPKWLIGFSSVISFTGFLYLMQNQQGSGQSLDAGKLAGGPDGNSNVASDLIPLSSTLKQNDQKSGIASTTFVHSRAEFQNIENLSPEARSEREKELEKLDWNQTSGNIAKIPSVKIVTPPSDNSATALNPPRNQSNTSGSIQSDRRTRRS